MEQKRHVAVMDALRVFAVLWIIYVHFVERLVGGWYIQNPNNQWPPLEERVARLLPFDSYGIWDIPVWLFVSLGRAGDQAVQLFLIISGFGVTWALLNSAITFPNWRKFYAGRFLRIYPKYWMAHPILFVAFCVFREPKQLDLSLLFSFLGIRPTQELFYIYSPAWWYIWLILQIYLVFPLLWTLMARLGWRRFAAVVIVVCLVTRTIGLWYFSDVVSERNYLDAWARGAIFITRLPEFVFGMAIAAAAKEFSWDRVVAWLFQPAVIAGAVLIYFAATALSATLLGNGVSTFLLGVSVFIIMLKLLDRTVLQRSFPKKATQIVSDRSYSIFLVHHPVILFLIPAGIGLTPQIFVLAGLVFVLIAVFTIGLDIATAAAEKLIALFRGLSLAWQLRVICGLIAVWASLFSAEIWFR